MHPEEGRNAIAAASRAIADLRLGQVDEQSTANVGVIEGGVAVNIVPDHCRFVGEARSHDEARLAELVQEMLESISFAAETSECRADVESRRSYRGYRFKRSDDVVRVASDALARRSESRTSSSAAAPRTRTSSTSAAFSASISGTG